mmetsp:Transcript_2283/g.3665  ORF Transcript_2283/g.3665 Transcript_2283/m.3665 type:complete len:127 (+) Transcript_2283:31-411(+)
MHQSLLLAAACLCLLSPALAFTSTAPALALRGNALTLTRSPRRASMGLSMQEEGEEPAPVPVKRTTGFKQVFTNISQQLSEPTAYVDEDGRRKLKATSAQIFVLLAGNALVLVVIGLVSAAVGKKG